MTEDEARQARVDRLIVEMQTTIAEAQETSARMADLFSRIGVEDENTLAAMVTSDRCSPALRAMVEADMTRLDRELKEEEQALLTEAGHRQTRRPHRRVRRMTRI